MSSGAVRGVAQYSDALAVPSGCAPRADAAALVSNRLPRPRPRRIGAGERFAVILCDLMLDPLSGIDLHEALVKRVPDQAARMIFMTGGAFTRQAQRFLEEVPNPHLQKPFDFDRLLALIDEIASS